MRRTDTRTELVNKTPPDSTSPGLDQSHVPPSTLENRPTPPHKTDTTRGNMRELMNKPRDDPMSLEVLREGFGSALAAPIRMKHRLILTWRTFICCHIDRLAGRGCAHLVGHRIPNHFLGAAIQNRGQVDESLPGTNVSNVTHPFHPRLIGREIPLVQVRARLQVRGGDCDADFLPSPGGFQAHGPHAGVGRVPGRC